jgi:hypothetical protein
VEGPDCIVTKAKNGTGKREAIEAKPGSVSLEKCLIHSDNHVISVSDPCVHEGPVIVGQDI